MPPATRPGKLSRGHAAFEGRTAISATDLTHGNDYGPVFAPIIRSAAPMPLDAGTPNPAVHGALRSLSRETAFGHAALADDDAADCCLAGIWLLHNYLDESHGLSQGVSTPDGSFWHGVMHRRESDYSNAKYWFRRVGGHPVFTSIAAGCGDPRWSPAGFVDACAAASDGGRDAQRCVETQQLEWALLFEHCYRTALGDPSAAGP